MEVNTAMALISQLIYKPGWSFEAADHTNRFEGSIRVKFHYPAQNSNRDQADEGYPEAIMTYAEFPIQVMDCINDRELYRCMMTHILQIEEHEAREFLRVKPTMWSPFHPHKSGGMGAWAATNVQHCLSRGQDLQFGIA